MKIIYLVIICFTITSLKGDLFVLNTISQTLSRIDLATQTVNNTFASAGLYSNQMAVTEDYIYLTNSGDNNLRKINIETGALSATIPLADYSNPYDIVIHEGFAYVTGMLTDKVYKIDLATDEVEAELAVGVAPQGLFIYKDILYVANSGFQYPAYLPGELTVIDLPSFTIMKTLSVPLNPQRMIVDSNGFLHLVCTGNYGDETGNIAVIDTSLHEIIQVIPLTTFPANIVITPGGRVYVGDSFGGGVFAYDTPGFEIIHSCDDLFSYGGSALAVYEEWLIIADAGTFSSNSVIRFYGFDEELAATFQTAIGAIDIAFFPEKETGIDETIIEPPAISVFPNPFRISAEISLPSEKGSGSKGVENYISVTIYNLRGQKITRLSSEDSKLIWDGKDQAGNKCAPGVYLIDVRDREGSLQTGKITLIR